MRLQQITAGKLADPPDRFEEFGPKLSQSRIDRDLRGVLALLRNSGRYCLHGRRRCRLGFHPKRLWRRGRSRRGIHHRGRKRYDGSASVLSQFLKLFEHRVEAYGVSRLDGFEKTHLEQNLFRSRVAQAKLSLAEHFQNPGQTFRAGHL